MARLIRHNKKENTQEVMQLAAAPPVSNFINFLLNDPSTPNLKGQIHLSEVNNRLFKIVNFAGPNDDFSNPKGIASNCCGILNFDLNHVYNKHADIKLGNWAATKCLGVHPTAGEMANAFYDRYNLKFFQFNSKIGKIYTALSADVVGHELGHAILDFLRPDFWSTASLEIFAFHEAFGDVFAFICSLHHDQLINQAMNETKGDLFESSIASRIGEQFGVGLGLNGYLRNVDNDLKYEKPSNLKSNSKNPEELTKEPHNFSRVISGAVYRIFAEIYTKKGKNKDALIFARNFTRDIFFKAAKNTPASADFSIGFGRILYKTAKNINPEMAEIVNSVLQSRNLLDRQPLMAAHCIGNDCKIMLAEEEHKEFMVHKYDHVVMLDDIVELDKHKCLSGVKVKIPCDDIVFSGRFGFQQSDMVTSVEAATDAINFIIEKNQINESWKVSEEGVLERNYIRCDGFVNNCEIEGQPEYGKCWKYRISGCGCGGPYGCPPEPKKIVTPVQNFCGANYSIKCTNTRTSACQTR